MVIPDFVKSLLRTAAPTLLAALGLPPPFSTIAASVVTGALDKYLPDVERPSGDTGQKPPLTPSQVTDVVQQNANNPELFVDLKKAEADLRKYELDAGIRFAEIEVRDRTRAGDFQIASGLASETFHAGMKIVKFAIFAMIFMIGGSLFVAFGAIPIPKDKVDLSTAAFGLIGTAVGFINGIAATIISFYYGSSQSSKEKGDAISATVRDFGLELGRVATRPAPSPVVIAPAPSTGQGSSPDDAKPDASSASGLEPATPASRSLLGEILFKLTARHAHFPETVTWELTKAGVAIDGAAPQGTAGNPTTVRRIWSSYGELCATSARNYGVPVELIVATIATESSGNPNARRAEPKVNDESVGLMQTLVGTARGALGRRSLKGDDLLDPATSIAAGTAYIAQQRGQTHFDPPRVAAAYNAGSIRRDGGSNRWRMLCYPKGTGQHIDRFVAWFNDCMEVAAADDWGRNDIPSFVSALGGRAPTGASTPSAVSAPSVRTAGVDFPPRPNFYPLKNTAARQGLFGNFNYRSNPQPGNKEHIDILGNWVQENIVDVQVTSVPIVGLEEPLTIKFHAKAAEQLQEMWKEWERAGLLGHILTFDGGFVPRFIRGSTTSLSCHSFGCAFDLNAEYNMLDRLPALAGRRGSVRELVEIANKHKFYWGGHFRSRLDGMHFEVAELI